MKIPALVPVQQPAAAPAFAAPVPRAVERPRPTTVGGLVLAPVATTTANDPPPAPRPRPTTTKIPLMRWDYGGINE